MAWINDRWVSRKERTELIETYNLYLAEIDADYPVADDMPEELALDYLEKAAELERLQRIQRCEGNLLEFSIEYFSDARNPDNDGNWEGFDITRVEDAPEFHQEIASIINVVSIEHVNAKIVAAAPRSHAKSTYLSKAFPVHEIIYRLRKYVIIISETPKVSKANMEWIRNQLKFNRKLREDFGPLLSPKDQSNIQDNGEGFIAWHADGEYRKQVALVEAASTGQALRGRNWNGSRPDLIILDDLEDARPGGNASTPEQRQSLRDWFSQTVIPLGDPKGKRTAFVYMGTTVHFDALLMQVLYNRSDFQSKVYRAIIEQPKRADLWEQCRLMYIDRENPKRLADARKFYEDNEDEMLRGSRVLWPEVQPLWKLMTWKWDNGSKAFNTEYMNNPIDEESMIFNSELFTFYDALPHNNRDNYIVTIGVDFAMGKQRGDYSAAHVVYRDKQTGVKYVVESFIERIKPDAFLDVVVNLAIDFQPDVIAVEAQMAQEFFADTLSTKLFAKGYPAHTRLKKIQQRARKDLRIEAMMPEMENGTIRFNRRHSLLLEQFDRYGQGGHDDGPDSLEMALSAQKSDNVMVARGRKRTR